MEVTALGVTTKTTQSWGWQKFALCYKVGDNDKDCTDTEYGEECDADDESDFCTFVNAGRTWLAFNIIALIAFCIAAGVIFMKKDGKFSKGAAGIGVVCIVIALIVYYAVADDVGIWESDPPLWDSVMLGWSGWLDIVAAICGIAGGVLG